MSEDFPLNASEAPLADIQQVAPGMITLRAPQDGQLAELLSGLGLGLPQLRQMTGFSTGQVGWMSPDELLILCPREAVTPLLARLTQSLMGHHHLAVDVSDARTMFRVDGGAVSQVLAKLSPSDVLGGDFPLGELRRTRLAQVPAAFWRDQDGFSVICFRSVGQYVHDLLTGAVRPRTGIY